MTNNLLNLSDLTTLITNPNTPPETRTQALKLKQQQITTMKAEVKAKLQQMVSSSLFPPYHHLSLLHLR